MLLSLIMFSLIDVCHTNSHLSWKSSWNIQPSKADVSITFVIVEHNFLSWQSVTFLTISLATKSFPRATYMDLISFTFMLLSLIMFSLIDVCHTNSHLSWKSSWNIQPSKADVSITFVIVEHNFLSWQSITFLLPVKWWERLRIANKKLSESYLHGFNLFHFYASFLDYVLSDRCVSHK